MPDMSYGWANLTCERLARLAYRKHGLKSICDRPFSGYGEDQDDTGAGESWSGSPEWLKPVLRGQVLRRRGVFLSLPRIFKRIPAAKRHLIIGKGTNKLI
jgi:nucleoside-diphosphate-sugar epimerase